MKKIIVLALLLIPSIGFTNPYIWPVYKIIDGDTIKFKTEFLPKELGNTLSIRIIGIDTPERKGNCLEESIKAEEAFMFTKLAISNASSVVVILKGWDKYGGRAIGEVLVDGESMAKKLINRGLARPYSGKTKKETWCLGN